MSRYLLGCGVACVLALGATTMAAQYPPANPKPQEPAAAGAPAAPAVVTVEGCLVREQDVPGRKPNVAERAGVMEDYILTNAKMVKGSAPAAAGTQAKREAMPTGTSGITPMYDVKGLEDSQLKSLVGQRVQIEGTFADLDRSASAKPAEDLVDLKGTTIRQVPGDCPPKK